MRWITLELNCRTSSLARENTAGEKLYQVHVYKKLSVHNSCLVLKLQGDEGTG